MRTSERRAQRACIAIGALGWLLLVVISTVDGSTRDDGYDLLAHWISLLALGSRSGLGTATLAIAGAMILIGAMGFGPALRDQPGGTWTARVLAALGLSLIVAAVFPVDPVASYPVGSEVHSPPSVDARLHAAAGAVAFMCFPAVGFVGARWAAGRNSLRRLALGCAWVATVSIVTCFALVARHGGQRWDEAYAGGFQRLALLAGTLWVVVMAVDLLRGDPEPPPPRSVTSPSRLTRR